MWLQIRSAGKDCSEGQELQDFLLHPRWFRPKICDDNSALGESSNADTAASVTSVQRPGPEPEDQLTSSTPGPGPEDLLTS